MRLSEYQSVFLLLFPILIAFLNKDLSYLSVFYVYILNLLDNGI